MVYWLKSKWYWIAGAFIGAVGGWAYWKFVGCLGGTCPIWSNMYIATGYGALIGTLLFSTFIPGKKKTEKEQGQ